MSLRQMYQPLRPNPTVQDRLVDEAMYVALLPGELLAEWRPNLGPLLGPRYLDPRDRVPITIEEVLDLRSIGNQRDYNRVYGWDQPGPNASSSSPGLQMGTW